MILCFCGFGVFADLADSQKVSNFAALYDTLRNRVILSINNQNLFRRNASI